MSEIPKNLRHKFAFDLALTLNSAEEKRCHRCVACQLWVTEEQLASVEELACKERDRRAARSDRRLSQRRARALGLVEKEFAPPVISTVELLGRE